jgi:hypothetical protein
MARALSYTPEHGPVITLGDLRDLVAQAFANGWEERQQVRIMGAMEVNFTHGPRATRITLVPGEVSDD